METGLKLTLDCLSLYCSLPSTVKYLIHYLKSIMNRLYFFFNGTHTHPLHLRNSNALFFQAVIGQRRELSATDAQQANLLYRSQCRSGT